MIELIDKDDFATFGIVLATNLEDSELTKYIREAQDFDVKPQLGQLLYFDILTYPEAQKYVDLLTGEITYTFQGHSYIFTGGLKAALCYYAYARYLPNSGSKNTEFGMVMKKNEFSEPIDTKTIQLQVNNAKSAAFGYMQNVTVFLNHKYQLDPTIYPLWHASGSPALFGKETNNCVPSGFRISNVGNI